MGKKFNSGEISCRGGEKGECIDKAPTILELAVAGGKASGLVATSQISHATPAAFGAHVFSRYCGAEIARQYIEESGVDVILGGGLYMTGRSCNVYAESFAPADKRQYIIDLAKANSYTFVSDKAGLSNAVSSDQKKMLGMFEHNGPGKGKTVEIFRVDPSIIYPEGEPTLAEMTAAALDILEKDDDGFFLLVEGSQIDWENHNNLIKSQIAESLGFDEAVKEVLDWISEEPSREKNTLIIVVADHETGGFAINGPGNALLKAGDIVEPGWTSGNHTAVDTIIYSQGPGSNRLNAALDNTDIYYVMEEALK
ncbi:alkaline phosphatase, partial [Thermodesulfobacteriota bacterium]